MKNIFCTIALLFFFDQISAQSILIFPTDSKQAEILTNELSGFNYEKLKMGPELVLKVDLMKSDNLINRLDQLQVLYEFDHRGAAVGQNEDPPDDTYYDRQWYLLNDGTFSLFSLNATEGADINIAGAWEISTGSPDITVAVLDTGLDPNNTEFTGRVWINEDEIPGNGIDDDNNGYVDDTNGWDFANEDGNPADDGGHGNAISGVIAANLDNQWGVAGIDQQCKIMSLKVLQSDQTGLYSDWAEGIYYAVDNGADVINMSIAGDLDLEVLSRAIDYAKRNNVPIVASTGNFNSEQVFYPSGYNSVIAVGGTDPDDSRSKSFNGSSVNGSNYGLHIDLVAPGNAIFGLTRSRDDVVNVWGGTSISSAIVTGVISLMLSVKPDATTNEIKAALFTSADDQVGIPQEDVEGWDKFHGFGRVNAAQALQEITREDLTDIFDVTVYPNPVDRFLNVNTTTPAAQNTRVRIVNSMGSTVYDIVYPPSSALLNFIIDTTSLPAGIYHLTISQQDYESMERFIVNHP